MGRIPYGSLRQLPGTATSPDEDIHWFGIPTTKMEKKSQRAGGVPEVCKQSQNEHGDNNDILSE